MRKRFKRCSLHVSLTKIDPSFRPSVSSPLHRVGNGVRVITREGSKRRGGPSGGRREVRVSGVLTLIYVT